MLEKLKLEVYEANILLKKYGLVIFTWGNVSGIDAERKYIVIKPSGVDYDKLTPRDMVVVDLNGNVIEGKYKPSSDTDTHIELYKRFPTVGGITHTHSLYATSFAQAGRPIKPYGTTHGDYFCGSIPCTRMMTPEEIGGEYEKNTGIVIAEAILPIGVDKMSAVLVHSHGPFTWGKDSKSSVEASVVLEEVAHMAFNTETLISNGCTDKFDPMQDELLKKHYSRKHGPDAYYGQKDQ